MSSTGVNQHTGVLLTGFDHVRQSLGVIFATRLTERVLHRTFGSAVPKLLGQPLTGATLMRFYMAIIVAIELWEPRFRVTQISYPSGDNSASALGQGRFGVKISGAYRPNALQGDFTVASVQSIIL